MAGDWEGCLSEIYIDGMPIRCDLELGHGGVWHSHNDVEDCSPDGGLGFKRPGADVMIVWIERKTEETAPLTKSEKGEGPQEKIQITVTCPTCQTQHVQDTVTGDSTRYSYCPPCRELRRTKPPDWMISGRHG